MKGETSAASASRKLLGAKLRWGVINAAVLIDALFALDGSFLLAGCYHE